MRAAPLIARRRHAVAAALTLLGACSSTPPAPDWQMNAKAASERAIDAYLSGNARVDLSLIHI